MSAVNTPSNEVSTSKHSHTPSTSSHRSACAACKYQRRKCTTDCPFAPFFPARKTGDFVNAHRFYGISNMLKLLKSVPSDSRPETMRSIIFLSNLRALDPVGGCYRQVLNLTSSINAAYTELNKVKKMISIVKAQQDAAATINFPILFPTSDNNVAHNQQPPLQEDYNNNIPYAELRPEVEGEQQSEQQIPTPTSNVEEVSTHPFLDFLQTKEPCPVGEREEPNKEIAGSSNATAHTSRTMNEEHFDPHLSVQEQSTSQSPTFHS